MIQLFKIPDSLTASTSMISVPASVSLDDTWFPVPNPGLYLTACLGSLLFEALADASDLLSEALADASDLLSEALADASEALTNNLS